MENDPLVSDTEANEYINQTWHELFKLMISSWGTKPFQVTTDVTIAALAQSFDLATLRTDPADAGTAKSFSKLPAIYFKIEQYWEPMATFNSSDEAMLDQARNWDAINRPAFEIQGMELRFNPPPSVAAPIRIQWIPLAQSFDLKTDAATLPQVAQNHEEYITIDVAKKMLMKEDPEGAGVQLLLVEKAALIQQIIDTAPRNLAQPKRIANVTRGFGMRPRGRLF